MVKRMRVGDKVGIVACSNGQNLKNKQNIDEMAHVMKEMGLEPVFSDFIYDKGFGFAGTGKERAHALMEFYKDENIKAIFDISGGDIGNEILPYLDYELIGTSKKMFWGYSDLTTIINAIYAKTKQPSVLYQVRHLANCHGQIQTERFKNTVIDGKEDLYQIHYEFLQGNEMRGITVGGNIRCLLKLAGTEYFPDMEGKILVLEARSGKLVQIVTYLSQLKQLGVYEKINGILLGTFTEMERNSEMPQMKDIIREFAGEEVPIACTREIGHGTDAKAIVIGEEILFKK